MSGRHALNRPQPRILPRPEHPVSRSLISEHAIKVMYRLHRSGFLGYLVGGAVRDLMLGRRPKDFDIGTDARPQQVRQLFRNARLIGRRFRLARVVFSDEVVEVATFRRSPAPPEEDDAESSDVLAPIREGEEFGTPEEDAWRRDFTVNGLFYNIADFSVIDYVGGLDDLKAGVIRTIGDPMVRFQEDPVRMMRAVEYSARLGFRIDEPTVAATEALRAEIHRAAPARIGYELLESLSGGQAAPIFRGLHESGLLALVVPEADRAVAAAGAPDLWSLLAEADARAAAGHRLGDDTLLALLFLPGLWPLVREASRGSLRLPELERSVRDALAEPSLRLALSNFRVHLLRYGFFLLPRLLTAPRPGKQAIRTVRHDAFPVAWQLARVVHAVTGEGGAAMEQWEQAAARVQAGVAPVAEPVRAPGSKRRRPRHRRRSRSKSGGGSEQ